MNGALKKLFGEIPLEWKICKLDDATEVIVDGTHFTPKYTKIGIPFLRVTDLKNKIIDLADVKYISKEEHLELIKRCKPQIGDILLSKNGTIGITKIVDWQWEFSVFVSLAIIRTKQDLLNNGFLKFFFNSAYLEKQIQLQVKQGTVTNLHLEEIRKFKIPLPSLLEQQKIATILTTVDDKLENIGVQITEYTSLKKGLMKKLFEKGIRHSKFKDSPLGEIPEEWEVLSLGLVSEIVMGQSPNSKNYNDLGIGKYLIQGNTDITNRRTLPRFWTSEITKECAVGDIIMTVRAPVGAVAKSFHDACIGRGVCAIRPRKLLNEYLYQYLIFFENKWKKIEQGSTFTAVSGSDIRSILIPIIRLPEQQKIATILSSVDTKMESLQVKKEEYIRLKKGLMEKLLTGKIRVKV